MKKKWNPWPVGLTAWFIFLIGFCIWIVIKFQGMNHDLVSSDYYAESLHHDAHRAAVSRTRRLENPPRIDIEADKERMVVYLPDSARGAVLNLYRPSDARMDLRFALQDGQPSVIRTPQLHPGRWQAKILWREDGLDYFFKKDLYIP